MNLLQAFKQVFHRFSYIFLHKRQDEVVSVVLWRCELREHRLQCTWCTWASCSATIAAHQSRCLFGASGGNSTIWLPVDLATAFVSFRIQLCPWHSVRKQYNEKQSDETIPAKFVGNPWGWHWIWHPCWWGNSGLSWLQTMVLNISPALLPC